MSEKESCPHCVKRKKKRAPEEQKDLLKRLKLAEGQIRGIRKTTRTARISWSRFPP